MERVGEGHADLRHAVALQQDVAAHLLPPLQDADRQERPSLVCVRESNRCRFMVLGSPLSRPSIG